MREKSNKKTTYGFLALLFLILFSMITVARPDNSIYPINNYFAFGESGQLKQDVYNKSALTESGIKVQTMGLE